MKKTSKLLLICSTMIFSMVSINNNLTSKIKEFNDSVVEKINMQSHKAKQQVDTSFVSGTGSEYVSDVKVQYGEGTDEGTGSIRIVAAVKADYVSKEGATLPGTYGFHVSYKKTVNDVEEVQNFVYDVENYYHSISEVTNDGVTYYTNDYSEHKDDENRKTIAELVGSDSYNLIIALTLDNVSEEHYGNLITVQPYVKLDGSEEYTYATNYRYVTVNDAKEARRTYVVDDETMSYDATDGYVKEMSLAKDQSVSIKDYQGNVVKTYTAVSDGTHTIKYDATSSVVRITEPANTTIIDESNVNTHGWKPVIESAVSGSTSNVNGNTLRYNITSSPKTDAWHIKLDNNVSTELNHSYTVKYYVNSSAAGWVWLTGGTGSGINIDVGENVIEKQFDGTGGDVYVALELGQLASSFTLDVTKVEILDYANEYVNLISDSFEINDTNSSIRTDMGSAGEITRNGNTATIKLTTSQTGADAWPINMKVLTGVSLEANNNYRISYDLTSTVEINGYECLFGNTNELYNNDDAVLKSIKNIDGVDGMYGQYIGAGETKTNNFIVEPTTNIDNVLLTVVLGKMPVGGEVTISNIKVEKYTQSLANTIHQNFYPSTLVAENGENSKSYLSYENGVYIYTIDQFGANDYDTKVSIGRVTLLKGRSYTFEFTGTSSIGDLPANFIVNQPDKGWDTLIYIGVRFDDTTTTYRAYTNVLTEDTVVDLLWQFGGANESYNGVQFEMSNFKITGEYQG